MKGKKNWKLDRGACGRRLTLRGFIKTRFDTIFYSTRL